MVDALVAFSGALTASIGPVISKAILQTTPPFQAMFLTSLIGFLTTIGPCLYRSRTLRKTGKIWSALLWIALLYQSLPACLTQLALLEVPSMFIVMLKRLQPLMIVILLLIFKDYILYFEDVIAACIAVTGVYFLLNADSWTLQWEAFFNPPVLAVVFSVMLWALMFIRTASITRGIPPVFIACATTGCLSLVSLPLASLEGPWNFSQYTSELWLLLLINGVVAAGLGLWAIFYSLQKFHPVLMSLIMLLGPLGALVLSVGVFQEELKNGQIFGVFLILGGLLIKVLFSLRRIR